MAVRVLVTVCVFLALGGALCQEDEDAFQERATSDPDLRHAPGADEYGEEEEGAVDDEGAGGVEDCSKWVAAEDRSSGKTYYYDRDTRVAVWELPSGCEGRVTVPTGGIQEPHRETKPAVRLASPQRSGGEWPTQMVHTPDGAEVKLTPDGVEVEWQEVLDGQSGNSYYWNKATGETTWDQPKHFTPREGGSGGAGGGGGGGGEWKQAFDPKTMKPYYYNTGTGQVQWEMPPEMTE